MNPAIAQFHKLKNFFTKELWLINTDELHATQKLRIKSLRVLFISLKGFMKDGCGIRASALTFYSLLSIVPVLAVAFGIAQGFGLQEILEEQIRKSFSGQEEVMAKAIEFSQQSLSNVKGGLVAGISVLFLLWSVVKLLNHIENAFNAVWNIDKPRTFVRKLTDYITLMIISPVFIIISSSFSVFITSYLEELTQEGMFLEYTGTALLNLMQLAPFVLISILFTLLFMIIPNKQVKFGPAIIAGIIAGSAFATLESGYIYFQLAMSRYNAIYGSFAALPLFLIWLQISWMIILLGAEISYAIQNNKQLVSAQETQSLSHRFTKLLSTRLLQTIAYRFEQGKPAPDKNELAQELNLPIGVVNQMLNTLLESGLIKAVGNKKKKEQYLPATAIQNLTLGYVLQKIDEAGTNNLMREKLPEFDSLNNKLSLMEESFLQSEHNQVITQLGRV